jgi:hypothetical protein
MNEANRRPGRPRTVTNARLCECKATCFVHTSEWCVAIVDAEDSWLLQRWKWSAQGAYFNQSFKARSTSYCKGTGKSQLLHQAVTGHVYEQLDHIDGNGHNCTKANLRPCSTAENGRNRGRQGNNYSSRFKGVSLRPNGKWEASIKADGRRFHLGGFDTEIEAAIAYNQSAQRLHGEFAWLNRIPVEQITPAATKRPETVTRDFDALDYSMGLVDCAPPSFQRRA